LLVNVARGADGAAGGGQGAGHLALIATVVGVDLVDAAAVGNGLVGG